MAVWAAVCAPPPAAAQTRDEPYGFGQGRVTFGGELAGMLSPRDDEAFFNYTDYERDALRMARLRLFGQWRVVHPFSVIAEVRTENADELEVAALYVRWRPFRSQEFDIQAGRIPSVIGSFPRRAYGRDNLVVGLPLAYQYLDLPPAGRAAGHRRRPAADARAWMAAGVPNRIAGHRAGRANRVRDAMGYRRRSPVADRSRRSGRSGDPRRAGRAGRP